jgi:hypothetical protein
MAPTPHVFFFADQMPGLTKKERKSNGRSHYLAEQVG